MKRILNSLCVIGLLPAGLVLTVQPPAVADSVRVVCMTDPNKGVSPIGMRNTFTLTQYADGNTTATYVSFPSNADDSNDQTKVTIGSTRTLTFVSTPVAGVRKALLAKPNLYSSLLGFKPEKGFKAVNDLLVCKPNTIASMIEEPTVSTPKERVCNLDTTKATPIGNRNLLNFKQLEDGTTIVTYERLPAIMTNIRAKATIGSKRVLTMYDMPIESVRNALLMKPDLYDELLGFKSENGFKDVNNRLVCQ